MAQPYRIPNFRKLYPEAGEEIIAVLKTTERKMQYQEYDLKTEQTVMAQDGRTVIIHPSREDSLDRLCDCSHQFAADQLSVEDTVIRRLLYEYLYAALRSLTEGEQQLIAHIYLLGKTEREYAKLMALSHAAIHKRKLRILSKLKDMLKEFKF